MCTFELFNFDTSTGTSLYQFTVPCAGTGVTGLQMFNPNADKWVHEKIGLLDSAISPLSVNQPIVSKLDTEGTIPSINKGALDQMRPRMLLSQSSKIIPMSNAITKGRMGDYEIRLTTMSYLVCHQSAVYNTEPDGTKTLS
jgi:hypothetical protein